MSCGCKKKHQVPVQQPAEPTRIHFVENGEVKSRPRPPEPIQTPAQQEAERIVEKLNAIGTP
jgi:hypothetical protein